jgi:hypothetical protein
LQQEPSKHTLPDPQAVGEQVIVFPEQLSWYVPQTFVGQLVAGVQQLFPSKQILPDPQLPLQSTWLPEQ